MGLSIKVPCWVEETDPVTGEVYDTDSETVKDIRTGMGASFMIKTQHLGKMAVWGEIMEINEDAKALKLQVVGKTGWKPLAEILDVLPHNEYVLLTAQATVGLANAEYFAKVTPDQVDNFNLGNGGVQFTGIG